MADTAFQVQYRQEFIATFEQRQSLLRDMVTTEVEIKGNQAYFLVAGSGGATAKTRGVNGLIPARADDNTQTAVPLVEWHDLVRKTSFNIFASQGNQRSLMQQTTMAVMNRKIDSDIITELNTGTVNTGAAVVASIGLVLKAKTILGNSDVPWDGNIFGAITPAFEAYLLQTKEFASADYIDLKKMDGQTAWNDSPKAIRWLGVTWVVHPNLPGAGTNAEKCFMWHRSAIGHAVNTGGISTAVGYDQEQDYSYARVSAFFGSNLLQNSGLVVMNHDGSAYVAA
jgi:hypothetical protein